MTAIQASETATALSHRAWHRLDVLAGRGCNLAST
jgi:hypothetical protein